MKLLPSDKLEIDKYYLVMWSFFLFYKVFISWWKKSSFSNFLSHFQISIQFFFLWRYHMKMTFPIIGNTWSSFFLSNDKLHNVIVKKFPMFRSGIVLVPSSILSPHFFSKYYVIKQIDRKSKEICFLTYYYFMGLSIKIGVANAAIIRAQPSSKAWVILMLES